MKKRVFAMLLAVLICAAAALPVSATARDGLCECGREYATSDDGSHMIFDCLGCGRNYTSCACSTCWCGARLERTFQEDGSIDMTRCVNCGLPCEECICRDRSYYVAMRDVKNGVTGTEIPNPANGLLIVLAVLLPFAAFCGIYFFVLNRRAAASTVSRSSGADRAQKLMERIDREPDGKLRYILTKARADGGGSIPPTRREAEEFRRKKSELLSGAVEDDGVRESAEEDLSVNRTVNDVGLFGSVEKIDRLWDPSKKGFVVDRKDRVDSFVGETNVKWETASGQIALFEAVTPLNGTENNRIPTGSNVTPFVAALVSNAAEFSATSPETEDERRKTIEAVLPGANTELLLSLPQKEGDLLRLPGLPPVLTPRRVGDRNRFPGGMKG